MKGLKLMFILTFCFHLATGQEAISLLNTSFGAMESKTIKTVNYTKIPVEIVRGMVFVEAELNGKNRTGPIKAYAIIKPKWPIESRV